MTSALLVRRVRNGHSDEITETVDQRSKQNKRVIDLTALRSDEFHTLRRSLRELKAGPEIISTSTVKSTGLRRINILITQYYLNIDYRKLVSENSIPIGFWRCLCDALFACHLSRIAPFKICCQTNLFRVCRRRPTFEMKWHRKHQTTGIAGFSSGIEQPQVELDVGGNEGNTFEMTSHKDRSRDQSAVLSKEVDQLSDNENCQRMQVPDCSKSESRTAETKMTWETVFKLISLTTVLVVLIPAPFYVRLAIYCVFEQQEASNTV